MTTDITIGNDDLSADLAERQFAVERAVQGFLRLARQGPVSAEVTRDSESIVISYTQNEVDVDTDIYLMTPRQAREFGRALIEAGKAGKGDVRQAVSTMLREMGERKQ